MKKQDLKEGWKIEYRNGEFLTSKKGGSWFRLNAPYINDDLTSKSDKEWDIMKVYDENDTLLWERVELKEGDLIKVRDCDNEPWGKGTLNRICSNGVVCVASGNEDNYRAGKVFRTTVWNQYRPIQKPKPVKMTVAQIAEKYNVEVVEETFEVGDKVKIIANNCDHGFEIGEDVTITGAGKRTGAQAYTAKTTKNSGWVYPSDIKRI